MFIFSKLKSNIDLTIAILFAVITGIWTKPTLIDILTRINFSLLGLLIFLMCIVAGLRLSGFFSIIFEKFFHGRVSSRNLSRFLIFSCYLTSMFITNDVALIIFVPLAIITFIECHNVRLIVPTVVWQTIAANMGSMLTPIGNPQNLFIYAHYQLSLREFLSLTAPIVAISGVLIFIASFFIPNVKLKLIKRREKKLPWKKIAVLLLLFSICLLHVLHFINFWLLAIIILPSIYVIDRKLFLQADYKLIFLFAALFIGVGNLAEISFFKNIPQNLSNYEFIISLLLSQIISNVPATVLLSEFTNAYAPLLLGVNIGGLGTMIASMASVISFKAYIESRFCNPLFYITYFTVCNLIALFILLLYYYIVM